MFRDISQTKVKKMAFPAVKLAYSKCFAVDFALTLLNDKKQDTKALIESLYSLPLPCYIKISLPCDIETSSLEKLKIILTDFKENDLKEIMKYARILLSGSIHNSIVYETDLEMLVSKIEFLLNAC